MNRDYRDYIFDIIDSINKIETFILDFDYEKFIGDTKTIFAVIRALEVIGEAVKNIPFEIRNEYKDIPWKEIAGMRDKLIHDYFGVNLEVVWKTITEEIPSVKVIFDKIYENLK